MEGGEGRREIDRDGGTGRQKGVRTGDGEERILGFGVLEKFLNKEKVSK